MYFGSRKLHGLYAVYAGHDVTAAMPTQPHETSGQVVFQGHDSEEQGIIYSLQPHNFTSESVATWLTIDAKRCWLSDVVMFVVWTGCFKRS